MKIVLPRTLAEPLTVPWERMVKFIALTPSSLQDAEEFRRAIDQLAARIAELERPELHR